MKRRFTALIFFLCLQTMTPVIAGELLPAQLKTDVITNIDLPNTHHYLMMRVTFFVETPAQQQMVEMLEPEIRAGVIELLNDRPLRTVKARDGKLNLERDIQALANDFLERENKCKPIQKIHLGNYKIE